MSHRFLLRAALALVCAGVAALASPAFAGPGDVRILPPQLEPVPSDAPVDLGPLAQRLAALLSDAMLDYGLRPLEAEPRTGLLDEHALTALATDSWVVQPELGLRGSDLSLRLVVVPRGSSVLLVRVQQFAPNELDVRSLSMLRELVEP
ncbi:MAG TPA: hypothetical protein VG963_26325, partial [Polyangiaceae bacterium]|nr:hypothetical protein [Polyangiaceae bacterium]